MSASIFGEAKGYAAESYIQQLFSKVPVDSRFSRVSLRTIRPSGTLPETLDGETSTFCFPGESKSMILINCVSGICSSY